MFKVLTMVKFTVSDLNATIEGQLTRHTVPLLSNKKSKALFNNALVKKHTALLDLSKVTKTDTAGLAWLLSMVEKANQLSCELKFTNVSQDLIKLAKLSSVDAFLPV